MSRKNKVGILIILLILLMVAFIFSGLNSKNKFYLLSKRIPKLIAIVITGGSIAFSSIIFQTITNNRILTPSILGLDSLYIFIQTFLVFILSSSNIFILNNNLNFLLSVTVMVFFTGLMYKFFFKENVHDIFLLLLIGLILGTFFQSLSSFMQMLIDPNEFLHIQDKMFASFNNINTSILSVSTIIVVLIIIYTYRYTEILDVLSIGREHSINLGIDYDNTVKKMLVIVSLLTSISTALVGPVTFLGLLVANLGREFIKTYKHRYLIIVSMFISIIALLGGQLLVERVFNFSTPISVMINFSGGLYFIYLLIKEGNYDRN